MKAKEIFLNLLETNIQDLIDVKKDLGTLYFENQQQKKGISEIEESLLLVKLAYKKFKKEGSSKILLFLDEQRKEIMDILENIIKEQFFN